jgi:ribosomal-protein-alanine N-acetyltransferase
MSARYLREADLDDVPRVAALFGDTLPDPGESPEQARERHAIRLREELTRTPRLARLVVAEDHRGELLGALLAWQVADEVTLLDVAVPLGARRGGHGRALVLELLEHGKKAGGALVVLEVRASNVAARTLYRSLGFEEIHVRRGYYRDGEDGLEMHARLDT